MGKQIKELTVRQTIAGTDMLPMQGANDLNYYGTVGQIADFSADLAAEKLEGAYTCDTPAADEEKEVTLTTAWVPSKVTVHFTNGNTYGDTTASTPTHPKLVLTTTDNVAHTYDICDSRGHYAGKGFCNAGDDIDFIISGSKARILNSDIRQADANMTIKADGSFTYEKNFPDLSSETNQYVIITGLPSFMDGVNPTVIPMYQSNSWTPNFYATPSQIYNGQDIVYIRSHVATIPAGSKISVFLSARGRIQGL